MDKTLEDWRALIDSRYAARDADGGVRQPNWIVRRARFDALGEFSGGDVVDVVASRPGEVPSRTATVITPTAPVDEAAVSARTGYDREEYFFTADWSGSETARYLDQFRPHR